MKCPKCGYQRQASDTHVHEGICPNCSIAYKKWHIHDKPQKNAFINHAGINTSDDYESTDLTQEQQAGLGKQFYEAFFSVPERVTTVGFYARLILFAVFMLWGGYFILGGIDWSRIGGSFLHNVILPFHEFGHVFFAPFGRFMAILGGSLFQVMMPLGLLLVFSMKYKDNFAAAIMLWWSGQSFIDISPYILDARYRSLPLVGGRGESSHDWGNLLTMTNNLQNTEFIAGFAFVIGTLLIILSGIWGALLLYKMKQNINDI